MSRKAAAQRISRHYDFSGGIIGNISERMRQIRHAKRADNVIFEPKGSASSRTGSRALIAGYLPYPAHSLGRYTNSVEKSGYVFAATSGGLYGIENGDDIPTLQTLPAGFSITSAWWSFAQLNNVLYATQRGDTQLPIAFITSGSSPTWAHGWKSTVLTAPASVPTGVVSSSATGVDAGIHYYRVRFMYRNGTSVAGPNSGPITTTPGNLKVTVTLYSAGTDTAPATDPDFIYCRLERVKAGAGATGNWWWVANIAKGTLTYVDTRADADLFERVDSGLFGTPPHLEGLVVFQRRLVGWSGSTVYVSQVAGDVQGTGPMNFDPDLTYEVGDDDGDTIQQVVVQGDRLVAFKSLCWYALEGDPTDFSVTKLGSGDGAAGPRCVTASGNTLFVLGPSGWRIMRSNSLEPFGNDEIGHYLAEMAEGLRNLCVAKTYRGRFVMLWYPSTLSSYCDQIVVFDLVQRNFTHFTEWPAADVLPLEETADFGSSTLVAADPVNRGGATGGEEVDCWFSSWTDSSTIKARVQKGISGGGSPQWATNGLEVDVARLGMSSIFSNTAVFACDDGGCVVASETWSSSGGHSRAVLYAQRYDTSGLPLWNGGSPLVVRDTLVTGVDGVTNQIKIIAAALGGFIIAWQADSSPEVSTAQKISEAGVLLWGAGAPTHVTYHNPWNIFPDSAGGCVVVGESAHAGPAKACHITYAGAEDYCVTTFSIQDNFAWCDAVTSCQDSNGDILVAAPRNSTVGVEVSKITAASGAVAWTTGPVFPAPNVSWQFRWSAVCTDGADGCFVAVLGFSSQSDPILLRRVNSAGVLQWAAPVTVWPSGLTYMTIGVKMVPDGAGGVFIAMVQIAEEASDPRVISLVHYSSSGAVVAAKTDVVANCYVANYVPDFNLITDGAGGCILLWVNNTTGLDLYAQRYSGLLVPVWETGGLVGLRLSSAAGTQMRIEASFALAPNGSTPIPKPNRYPLWSLFKGRSERAVAAGWGGEPLSFMLQTPPDDDGEPEVTKEYKRAAFEIDGDSGLLAVSLELSPGERSVSIPLTIKTAGYVWGDDDDTTDDEDLVWADDDGTDGGEWAADESTTIDTGIMEEAIGRASSTKFSAELTGALKINGHTLDWNRLPERRYT